MTYTVIACPAPFKILRVLNQVLNESGVEAIGVMILTTAVFQIAMTMIRAPQASSMGFVSQGEQNKSSASDEISVLNRIKD